MFERETRRAKILEARGRARRDNRVKSGGHGEVKFILNLFIYFEINLRKLKKQRLMVQLKKQN
jgi:hypothetical protein